jgi:hypothetical protein
VTHRAICSTRRGMLVAPFLAALPLALSGATANGEFYPINSDTTAAFSLIGNTLQATFKGPTGQTDTMTCTLVANQKKMTCKGVLSSGDGRTTTYVDVYDRM